MLVKIPNVKVKTIFFSVNNLTGMISPLQILVILNYHSILIMCVEGAGAFDAVLSRHWAEGGAGARELALAVEAACQVKTTINNFQLV